MRSSSMVGISGWPREKADGGLVCSVRWLAGLAYQGCWLAWLAGWPQACLADLEKPRRLALLTWPAWQGQTKKNSTLSQMGRDDQTSLAKPSSVPIQPSLVRESSRADQGSLSALSWLNGMDGQAWLELLT